MDEWLQMVEDCEKRESKLTAWEVDFISSVKIQLEKDVALTEKQDAALTRVWERVT